MAGFETFNHGRFYVHVLPTKQFKTRHVSVKVSRPITRENATATALLSYLLMEGTEKHPTQQAILNYADDLYGASIRTGIGKRGNHHVLESNLSIPDESNLKSAQGLFQKGLDLVFEVLTNPKLENKSFVPSHVQREKGLHKKRIESLYDDKVSYAMERCLQEMCEGTPVGIARLGYLNDIDGIRGEDLWELHRELLSQAEIHVYVVGDVSSGEVRDYVVEQLSKKCGDETRGRTAPASLESFVRTHKDVRYIVDREPVNQGKLNLGFTTGVSYATDDYPKLMICNGVLGGFPHSKLFINVREKESLAYYASSRLDALSGILAVQTGIEIVNYEKALNIIIEQVQAIQQGNVTEQELSFTQRGIRNQYLQLADQPQSMMDVHFSGVLAGVNRDIPELLNRLKDVSVDDVVQISQGLDLDTVYFLRNEEVTQGE